MTSISSLSNSTTTMTPLQRLQQELAAEESDGTVSASDASALSTALSDIDSTLQSDASSSEGTTPPSSEEMQAKVESLIDQEVKSGKLTSDQGEELKKVFAATFASGTSETDDTTTSTSSTSSSTDSTSSSTSSTSDTDDSSTTSSSTSSTSTDEMEQLVAYFLKLVQQSNGQTSGYNASGQSTSASSSVLLDTQT
jgi:hypothetical protein